MTVAADPLFEIDGEEVPLRIQRHRQARRISLRVDVRDGSVVLVLPHRVRVQEGLAFAVSKAEWLVDRRAALPPPVPLADGALLPLRGVSHRVVAEPRRPARVNVVGRSIVVGGDEDDLERRLLAWLRTQARSDATERAEEMAAAVRRRLGRVSVRDPRSRWGSCSARGDLSFSWRLVLAPPWILDYVVAHEVSHLVHRHHGPSFWRTVERLVPDFEAAREWLRQAGAGLHRIG